jgi:hypothetical protein
MNGPTRIRDPEGEIVLDSGSHINAAVERRRHGGVDVAPYRERRPLERLVRRADFATRTNPFKASLTASDVGNAAAFSRLRTTTFEPAARRAAYFPRTNPAGKSDRLYDLRSSSLLRDLAFLIEPTFWACRRPCADDANDVTLFGMGHGEEPLAI